MLGLGWSLGGGKKWSGSGYILKAELTGFTDRLDVGYSKKRGFKDDFKDFVLSNEKMKLPFAETQKTKG